MLYTGDRAGEQYAGSCRHPAATTRRARSPATRCRRGPMRDGACRCVARVTTSTTSSSTGSARTSGHRRRPRRERRDVRRARINDPFTGLAWGLNGRRARTTRDDTMSYIATSGILPPDEFKQFESWPSARWDKPGGPFAPHTGDQYVYSQIADVTYKRLTRTITVPAGGATMSFWTSYDTEADWDYVFVEAHTVGQDNWTTLPDANGHTTTGTGESCPAGWNDLHPWLDHYQTLTRRPLHPHWHDRRVERGQRQLERLAAVVGQPRRVCGSAGRGLDHLRQRLGHPGSRRLRRRHRRLDRRGQHLVRGGPGRLGGHRAAAGQRGQRQQLGPHRRLRASRSERRSRHRARSSWASGWRASRRPLNGTP